MLASGLFDNRAQLSILPLQNHIVPMDQLGAPKVAENVGDFTALAPDDGLGVLMAVSGEPAADLNAVAVPDDHRVAPLETPLDPRDAGRQQALACGQRLGRAIIDDERALRLERAGDPALPRRHRVLARQEPGRHPRLGQRLKRMHHLA